VTTTIVRRPARIATPAVPDEQITIADPPTEQQAPPAIQGASMILMPVMSGVGSLTMAMTNRNQLVVMSSMFVLIGSITIGVIMIIAQKSGPKKLLREGRERYHDYIEELRHELRRTIAAQKKRAAWCHPEPGVLPDIARTGARRWERRRGDADFLDLRIGTGDQPIVAALRLDADTGPLNQFDPVSLDAALNLQSRYSVLHEQPVTLDLRRRGTVSIVGDRRHGRTVAQAMIGHLVAFHSPEDVRVGVVRADSRASEWDWVKWLPHCQSATVLDGDVPARLVTTTSGAMSELLYDEFEARLAERARSRGRDADPRDHLVVFIDSEGMTGLWNIESPDSSVPLVELGVHVVVLLASRREEPELVDDRIEVTPDGWATIASRPFPLVVDQLPDGLTTLLARQLAPLRATRETTSGDEALTSTVGLPDILGVDDPAALDPQLTWRRRGLRDLLRVPIGVGANGGVVLLDLKESAHGGMGPHGLVVGATGSGKSEMLRTLVSSLVINHPPERLALMLVDFKGGATFAAMDHIPHIAGIITNLQDDLTLVDRMRDALFGEMQRRQEVLKAAGNLPNVTEYHELIEAGHELESLPHLLVIVDEFSELLTAKPDFADLFVAIGRIGRSIGVHLLLASQKLETGKIRGLESHLSYRISLRTFSEAESRDTIGVPDAYHLPPEPGSGYLKVDTTIFERFKAALVSSTYVAPTDGPKAEVPAVPYLAVNGLGSWIARMQSDVTSGSGLLIRRPSRAGNGSRDGTGRKARGQTVLDVICRQLEDAGADPVRPVWLPPLPPALPLDNVLDVDEYGNPGTVEAILGLVDDPARQNQFPLRWDFTGAGGNLVVYGAPQSGKSTLLRTLIASLSLRYPPGDVAFYCLDFGGGTLRSLAGIPHLAAATPRTDPERISRTINDVVALLEGREEVFRRLGVSGIEEFRRARADGRIPKDSPGDVFLVIDGFGSFREEYDTLDYLVADVAARGLNYGVHVVVSANQTMDVRMRMQPSFGGRIELRLNDTFDSAYGRQLAEQVVKDCPGRGLVEPKLLFHTALPRIDGASSADQLAPAVESLVTYLQQRWPEQAVDRVQVLPVSLDRDQLPDIDPAYPGIPIGVLDRNLNAVSIDLLGNSPHLLVFGDGETGKTNLLRMLIKGYMEYLPAEQLAIAVVDFRRSLLDVVADGYNLAYATDAASTERMTLELAEALNKRMPGSDVTSAQLRNRTWWEGPEVLLVVDDYDLVSTSTGNPLNPLVDYFTQGRDLGFHFVLARRMGGFARAQFEPVIQRLTDLGTSGLIFSGDRTEGRVIGGVTAQPLPVGRALYATRNGLVGQVQTAICPE
jgi:DNA segregation ATPase FtsK/SpoIIIE, S-DNA-T family